MGTPRLLDLFCGGGGSARGYQLAGFQVVGIDLVPQKHYIGEAFVQMNAIAALDVLLCGGGITDTQGNTWHLGDFAAIHASPPCQGYSIMRNLPWLREKVYPLLIAPTRELLDWTGLPYIIENVAGARYRASQPTGLKANWLCGQMFGLPILRHRYFETNWAWFRPAHGRHWGTVRNGLGLASRARDIVTITEPVYSHAEDARGIESWPGRRGDAGHGISTVRGLEAHFRENGARKAELTQAIPPVMAQYLGTRLLEHLAQAA